MYSRHHSKQDWNACQQPVTYKRRFKKTILNSLKRIAMKTIILFLFSLGLVSASFNRRRRGLPKVEDCGKIRDNPYTGGTHYLCDFYNLRFHLRNFATLRVSGDICTS